MATQSQIDANRRNSQKSTGPRSDAGRTASSQNALRHGLYAKAVVIPSEDPDAFAGLQLEYLASHDPQTPAETALVLELVRCDWLLRRMTATETQLWTRAIQDRRQQDDDDFDLDDDSDDDKFDESLTLMYGYYRIESQLVLIQRRLSALGRSFHRALDDLRRLQSARAKSPAPQPALQPHPAAAPPIGFVPPICPAPPQCPTDASRPWPPRVPPGAAPVGNLPQSAPIGPGSVEITHAFSAESAWPLKCTSVASRTESQ